MSELRDGASQDKRYLSPKTSLSAREHTQSMLRAVSLAHKEAAATPGVPTGQRDGVEFLGVNVSGGRGLGLAAKEAASC